MDQCIVMSFIHLALSLNETQPSALSNEWFTRYFSIL